jgi:hypothetical protein
MNTTTASRNTRAARSIAAARATNGLRHLRITSHRATAIDVDFVEALTGETASAVLAAAAPADQTVDYITPVVSAPVIQTTILLGGDPAWDDEDLSDVFDFERRVGGAA